MLISDIPHDYKLCKFEQEHLPHLCWVDIFTKSWRKIRNKFWDIRKNKELEFHILWHIKEYEWEVTRSEVKNKYLTRYEILVWPSLDIKKDMFIDIKWKKLKIKHHKIVNVWCEPYYIKLFIWQ